MCNCNGNSNSVLGSTSNGWWNDDWSSNGNNGSVESIQDRRNRCFRNCVCNCRRRCCE